jgi:hypothetical protein
VRLPAPMTKSASQCPGSSPAVDLGGTLADVDRSGQLDGELAFGAGRGGAAWFLAPQMGDRLFLNSPFSVDADEIVNGLVAHASGGIKAMAPSQGDLDLLGRGPGGQQRPHLVLQGGVVGDFVVGGLRGTTTSPRLRIDSAVVLTSAIAGNLAIDHRGIAVELSGELCADFALDQTDIDRFSFFGADALWGVCHQTKAPTLRPRRQRGIVPRGRTAGPPSRPCRPPSGLSTSWPPASS